MKWIYSNSKRYLSIQWMKLTKSMFRTSLCFFTGRFKFHSGQGVCLSLKPLRLSAGFKQKKSIWHAWTKFPLSRLWNSRDIGQNLSGVFLSDTRGGRAWSSWKKCLVTITAFKQGHPTTVFPKISVQRNKYWLKLSITRGRLKTSRWPFHSFAVFEAYLINSLLFFEV